ncbi:MAG TPA: Crp/Fnr family transcriptional regulator [Thermoanaerobaculia bacterium]|nr:Crp/Fnr family transcriptional regulator [Thermoanaerobaculia bacterium]
MPETTRERIASSGKEIAPPLGTVLIEQGQPTDSVYFPIDGAVISLTRSLEDGMLIEVGVVGHEGFGGLAAVFDPRRHLDCGIVQAEGAILQVPLAVVSEEIAHDEVRQVLFRYANAFMMQIAQTALCNRLHTIEQRLTRWILAMQDRTRTEELRLTQQFLSHMLGTRLAGVNEAVQSLVRAGLIRHARNRIAIIDRPGLEAASCECYRVVRDEFDRLVR